MSMKRTLVLLLGVFLLGCAQPPSTMSSTSTASPVPSVTPTNISTEAPQPTATPLKPSRVVISSQAEKISQLVGDYDAERETPTNTLTGERYNLPRTDLGVPFEHNGRTYILFGDAWNPPDDPIAFTDDTNPEDGLDLTFLQNSTGAYLPVEIPGVGLGAFEVPMEGVSVAGKMYVYATTDHSASTMMGRSVVARSDDDGYSFSYLYDLSTQHFINVSVVEVDAAELENLPAQDGAGLMIFGSGDYRRSDVHLAFQPAAVIEAPETIQYFAGLDAADLPMWSMQEADAQALFNQPCVGELSVSYNEFIGKWIMLYNCASNALRGINLRTADDPWGPWTDAEIIFHPWDDEGYCHFIHVSHDFDDCDNIQDAGRENEWGGEYGPYQFEHLAVGDDTSTTIYFTMSTWNPYTVVLMKATLQLVP